MGDRSQNTLWNIKSREDSGHGHSTQKPVECMRRPILNHTKQDELVYDPFLGSGTTLIAAELTERVCLGLELDPRYCDVIVERWQNLTGKQATLHRSAQRSSTSKKGADSNVMTMIAMTPLNLSRIPDYKDELPSDRSR